MEDKLYTLEEAEIILKSMKRRKLLNRLTILISKEFIIQRLIGVSIVIIGLICLLVDNKDMTGTILLIPLGLWLLLSSTKILD